jgi:lipoate-protein ligase A
MPSPYASSVLLEITPGFLCIPARRQMAIDAHLLSLAESLGGVVFRLYRMTPPAVTIGMHQRWGRVVDETTCRTRGWDWVRRPTGGGALLHKEEINYAIIAPRGAIAPIGPGEFRGVFGTIGTALSRSLEDMGLGAQLRTKQRTGRLSQHGLCGRSMTLSEVGIGDKKIIAAAQLITPRGILQHGTIYLRSPQVSDRFWPEMSDRADTSEVDQRWAELGPSIRLETAIRSLEVGFRRYLPVNCREYEFTSEDWRSVEAIVRVWEAEGWHYSR